MTRKRKPENPIAVYLYGTERLCARCGPAMSAEEWSAVKRCTLPCERAGCTSPHPPRCFCWTCRPEHSLPLAAETRTT